MSTHYFIDWLSPVRKTAVPGPTGPGPVLARIIELTPNPEEDGGFSFVLTDGLLPEVIRAVWLPLGADRTAAAETIFDAPQLTRVDLVPTGPQLYRVMAPLGLPDGDWDVAVIRKFTLPDTVTSNSTLTAAPTPAPA